MGKDIHSFSAEIELCTFAVAASVVLVLSKLPSDLVDVDLSPEFPCSRINNSFSEVHISVSSLWIAHGFNMYSTILRNFFHLGVESKMGCKNHRTGNKTVPLIPAFGTLSSKMRGIIVVLPSNWSYPLHFQGIKQIASLMKDLYSHKKISFDHFHVE